MGCSGLQGALIIPDSVRNIGDNAFENCSGLSALTIPSYVAEIGWNAFKGCSGIDTIYSNAINPPAIFEYTFGNIDSNIPVIVPCGQVPIYNNAEYWSNFTNIQDNCVGVECIEMVNFEFYPNPVGNILNIIAEEPISEIEIVNAMGQVVYRADVNSDNAVCDVEGLTAGVYIVRIHGTNTASVVCQRKFIKE